MEQDIFLLSLYSPYYEEYSTSVIYGLKELIKTLKLLEQSKKYLLDEIKYLKKIKNNEEILENLKEEIKPENLEYGN